MINSHKALIVEKKYLKEVIKTRLDQITFEVSNGSLDYRNVGLVSAESARNKLKNVYRLTEEVLGEVVRVIDFMSIDSEVNGREPEEPAAIEDPAR